MSKYKLHTGDCREVMAAMEAESVDAIVSDPPYGLSKGPTKHLGDEGAGGGFMGKGWDHGVPGPDFWVEALRVAKPGAHLLAFGGTRTYHRLACAIEDAGWELRDCVMWVYGSGFPKSHNVSKAIDKMAGAEREVVGQGASGETAGMQGLGASGFKGGAYDITAPATDAARRWEGWGTALKPAYEPIIVARKPFKGTVAANVLEHGTGAINVDGCRVGGGRWPANLIHDGSPEVLEGFPGEGGKSASRFYYCAKASRSDRDAGLGHMPVATPGERTERAEGSAGVTAYAGGRGPARNTHPTVKPTSLMRYLVRLVTPPGGVVLDPFMGSGSTGRGAVLEGFGFVGIDITPEYIEIARARIEDAASSAEAKQGESPEPTLFK